MAADWETQGDKCQECGKAIHPNHVSGAERSVLRTELKMYTINIFSPRSSVKTTLVKRGKLFNPLDQEMFVRNSGKLPK